MAGSREWLSLSAALKGQLVVTGTQTCPSEVRCASQGSVGHVRCQSSHTRSFSEPVYFSHLPSPACLLTSGWLICATERVDTLPCQSLFTPQELYLSRASSESLHSIITLVRACRISK